MYGTTYINHAARPATPDPAAGTVGMAPDWLTSSRLHPAPHTQAIARPRLMACCAEAAGQGHIWMALAPAGFGKTVWLTQAHSLLQSAGRPAGWLSLTADENHPERLIISLIHATMACRNGKRPQPSPPPIGAMRGEAGLARLLNMLAATDEPSLLVDNLEALTDPQALAAFDRFVTDFPPAGRLLLAGRRYGGSRFRKLVTEGRLIEVGASELRFDRSEMSELCGALGEPELRQVAKLTEGWPVGVRILSKHLEQGQAAGQEERPLSAVPLIADYLDEQILAGLDGPLLEFLMESSVLGLFTLEMLERVPGRRYRWSDLKRVLEAGFYLEARDQSRTWFGYLPLFSDHLTARLRREDPGRVKTLHRFAAEWLAEHGHSVEALRHAVSTDDTLFAAEIGERVSATQIGLGDGVRVLDYSRFLSPADADRFPMVALGQVYLATEEGRFREARATLDHLRDTHDIFHVSGDQKSVQISAMASVLEHVLRVYENRPVDTEEIRALAGYLDMLSDDVPVLRASVAAILSAIYIRYCRFEEAVAAADTGRAALTGIEADSVSFYLRITGAIAALRIGQMREASLHVERAIEIAHKLFDPKGKDMATALILKAQLHYEANETQAARSTLSQALERSILLIGWFDIYAATFDTAAAVAADSQDPDMLADILHEAESIARVRNLAPLRDLGHVLRLRETTRAGDYQTAMELLNSDPMQALLASANDPAQPSSLQVQTQGLLEAARLMAVLGRYRESENYLGKVDGGHIEAGDIGTRLTYKILKMTTAFHLRRHAEACDHLRVAVSIGLNSGMTRRLIENKDQIINVADWMKRVGRPLPGKAGAFIENLRRQHDGCWPAAPAARPRIRSPHDEFHATSGLSPREIEVLTLLSDGHSSKEIAARLHISDGTVKTHRKKINAKLGVSSRSGALAIARKMMII